ncbi:MAG: hypothetical protein JXR76_06970 [Deltaproteobacteria bacterium]|nr:hypothetical protein [Deltaproteobacteria bacterium]
MRTNGSGNLLFFDGGVRKMKYN